MDTRCKREGLELVGLNAGWFGVFVTGSTSKLRNLVAVKVQSRNRTQVELDQELLHELIETLRDLRPAEVILFGSRAKCRSTQDSDIDLVVILDTQNPPRTYAEALRNRMTVNRSLRTLRARVAIDLLVYTLDEWKRLQEANSSFVREIRETGLRIL